jgi:tannase/feruloyl esterase
MITLKTWLGSAAILIAVLVMANKANAQVGGDSYRKTSKFARLFMAPGVFHCDGGPGPAPQNDTLFDALVNWVEKKKRLRRFSSRNHLMAGRYRRGHSARIRALLHGREGAALMIRLPSAQRATLIIRL